jgi:hypothetical protein
MASQSPFDQAQEALWKALPAILSGAALGLWAWLGRARQRWRKAAELRRLEAKAVRYMLDRDRHVLHALLTILNADGETRLIDVDELIQQKRLLDDVREELWIADGHESMRGTQRVAEEVIKAISRTQRIQAKTERLRAPAPEMFKDGWQGDGPEDHA